MHVCYSVCVCGCGCVWVCMCVGRREGKRKGEGGGGGGEGEEGMYEEEGSGLQSRETLHSFDGKGGNIYGLGLHLEVHLLIIMSTAC